MLVKHSVPSRADYRSHRESLGSREYKDCGSRQVNLICRRMLTQMRLFLIAWHSEVDLLNMSLLIGWHSEGRADPERLAKTLTEVSCSMFWGLKLVVVATYCHGCRGTISLVLSL